MQHSKATKIIGGSAKSSPKDQEEGEGGIDFNLPNYFGKFHNESSQNKNTNNQQSYWKLDWGNDNEDNYEIVDQVVSSLGIHSDDEECDKYNDKFDDYSQIEKTQTNRINVDAAKVK